VSLGSAVKWAVTGRRASSGVGWDGWGGGRSGVRGWVEGTVTWATGGGKRVGEEHTGRSSVNPREVGC